MDWNDVVETFGVPDWDDDPTVPIAPGGESWSGFVVRASDAVRAVVRAPPGRAGGGGRPRRGDRGDA